jgi:hypothetical protein
VTRSGPTKDVASTAQRPLFLPRFAPCRMVTRLRPRLSSIRFCESRTIIHSAASILSHTGESESRQCRAGSPMTAADRGWIGACRRRDQRGLALKRGSVGAPRFCPSYLCRGHPSRARPSPASQPYSPPRSVPQPATHPRVDRGLKPPRVPALFTKIGDSFMRIRFLASHNDSRCASAGYKMAHQSSYLA